MFRKPPSKLESLRDTVTDTVAGTFDSIHEKLEDFPPGKIKGVKESVTENVVGTVAHGFEAAGHGWEAAAHKAGDALHAASDALKGATQTAKGVATGGIVAGASTAHDAKKHALEAAHSVAHAASQKKSKAQKAAAHAAKAAREKAQHKVESLSAVQAKIRQKLEKKLHKEARHEAKFAAHKMDDVRDGAQMLGKSAQLLSRKARDKRDDYLPEVQIGDTTSKWLWIGVGVLAGVLLGILLAPTTGRRTRALVKDKLNKAGHGAADLGQSAKGKAADLSRRAAGKIHEIKGDAGEDFADDATIADRVRTALGENSVTRNMERLNIDCVNGIVTVRGPMADTELQSQIDKIIRSVKGVIDVQSFLLVDEPEADAATFIG